MTDIDRARRLVAEAGLVRFFHAELENEAAGGVSPGTVTSAFDSLVQAPDDVLDDWVGTGAAGRRAIITLAEIAAIVGWDTQLRDLFDPRKPAPDRSDAPADLILAYGDLAGGFTFVGPVAANDPGLEELTDVGLHNQYWWYVPLKSLSQARQELL